MLYALAFVLLAAAPLPVPEASALAAAEAEVQEVFGRDLTAARNAPSRAALARRMIDTAEGSQPAAKYALLVRARELAIAAKDSGLGVEAAEGLAAFAGPADASEGHRLWSAARDLAGKLAAAEVYLRALPSLAGFERAAVEKRLRELGWRVSPIDFNFDDSTEGWAAEKDIRDLRIERGHLMGWITGGDPFLLRKELAIEGDKCPLVRIRLSLDSDSRGQFLWITKESPTWGEPKVLQWSIQGDGQSREYRLDLSKHPAWAGQTIVGLRIDPGDWDHMKPRSGAFTIDYVRGCDASRSSRSQSPGASL